MPDIQTIIDKRTAALVQEQAEIAHQNFGKTAGEGSLRRQLVVAELLKEYEALNEDIQVGLLRERQKENLAKARDNYISARYQFMQESERVAAIADDRLRSMSYGDYNRLGEERNKAFEAFEQAAINYGKFEGYHGSELVISYV